VALSLVAALAPWVSMVQSTSDSASVGAVAVGLFATAVEATVASGPFLGQGAGAGDVLVLTVMGTATGAGTGALVGLSIPSWRNIYRRR
jgi:hypothetical protein